jgi:hypothetical protein
MTAAAWISVIVPVATFLAGHFHLLLPPPSSSAPTPPTTIGGGVWIKYLAQELANLMSQSSPTPAPSPAPSPAPVSPGTDWSAVVQQLLSLLEQSIAKQQTPVKPA